MSARPVLSEVKSQVELVSDHSGRPRYNDGWRAGRPVEDPEKTKTWGFITAKPSEYLVHMRRGKVLKSSGQGATCFKWPWDSVAVVPTTIARLQFRADQVTREKVGVEVTGLAVYRIVDPQTAYMMLNFSYGERATEKLQGILNEMFVGSVRRIVAGMTVDDCFTKRKEGLAEEIIREIAPIVTGRGRSNDTTSKGWGVVIDTIEIQDVRVLSNVVFANMQASFRNELALKARTAELEAAKAIAEKETRNQREIMEARIAADAAMREQKAKAESKTAEIENAEAIKREKTRAAAERVKVDEQNSVQQAALAAAAKLAADKRAEEQARLLAEVEKERQVALAHQEKERVARLAELAREQAVSEGMRHLEATRFQTDREKAEHEAELAQWAAHAKLELERTEQQARLEMERAHAETQAQLRERGLLVERAAGETANAIALLAKQVDNTVSEEAIRRDFVQTTLPQIAAAFSQNFGEIRFTQFGGGSADGADPLTFVAKAFAQVLEVAKGAGIDVAALGRKGDAKPAAGEPAGNQES